MIKALLVDDEQRNLSTLSHLLADNCPQVQVCGLADSAGMGKELIMALRPQLIFLDIEMPYGNGFDLLRSIPDIDFEVIFVTAFDQYAINAFRYAAVDYLLKPIDEDLLREAVCRAEEKISNKISIDNYALLIKNLQEQNLGKQRILLNDIGHRHVIAVEDIMYCIAEGSYTHVHTAKKTYLSSRKLKDFEQMLPENMFYRIHHGHMINLQHVERLQKGSSAVLMHNGKELEIAVRRKDGFMKAFLRSGN
jgi:two-component system LytT family response regulator